jgi:hypothetical protein
MTTMTPRLIARTDPGHPLQPLPETLQLTAATIRAWREAGYRVSEQRVANWLYLLARGNRSPPSIESLVRAFTVRPLSMKAYGSHERDAGRPA